MPPLDISLAGRVLWHDMAAQAPEWQGRLDASVCRVVHFCPGMRRYRVASQGVCITSTGPCQEANRSAPTATAPYQTAGEAKAFFQAREIETAFVATPSPSADWP